MSLVDYASSDDEDAENRDQLHDNDQTPKSVHQPAPPLPPPGVSASRSLSTTSSLANKPANVFPSPATTAEKLPDASLLFSSPMVSHSMPGSSDHYSRVAAAVAESASRKREGNGTVPSSIRGKVPRGSIPHSKSIPDTGGGHLVPPQLRGRSNVVTEDIGKLFVKKQGQT